MADHGTVVDHAHRGAMVDVIATVTTVMTPVVATVVASIMAKAASC